MREANFRVCNSLRPGNDARPSADRWRHRLTLHHGQRRIESGCTASLIGPRAVGIKQMHQPVAIIPT